MSATPTVSSFHSTLSSSQSPNTTSSHSTTPFSSIRRPTSSPVTSPNDVIRHSFTMTRGPSTTRTRFPDPVSSSHTEKHRSTGQKPIAIFFEVLCGLVLFGLMIALLRCFCSYRRTPTQDRIAAVVNRHHLEREMRDIERSINVRRHSSLREPAPPPYFPPPPTYLESSISSSTRSAYTTDYSEIPPSSPPAPRSVLRPSMEEVELHSAPSGAIPTDSPRR